MGPRHLRGVFRKKIEKKNGKGVKYRGKVTRRGVVTVS